MVGGAFCGGAGGGGRCLRFVCFLGGVCGWVWPVEGCAATCGICGGCRGGIGGVMGCLFVVVGGGSAAAVISAAGVEAAAEPVAVGAKAP